MKKISFTVILLSMFLCFALPQLAQSSTIVTVNPGGTFINIGSFNFEILGPSGTTVEDNYTSLLDTHWNDFSGGTIVNGMAKTSAYNLSGNIGTFNVDNVVLGNWVFGNQLAVSFTQGVDYIVTHVGTNYVVSSASAVPIPAAVWLLGSGLIGLIGLRRRMKK